MADASFDDFVTQPPVPRRSRAARVGRVVNMAGAVVSVGLVAGVAVWGYRLAVRDVTGVPVILAMSDPMRIAPEDPGGRIAAQLGLSVNAVAAEGTAAPLPDQLILAPRPPKARIRSAISAMGMCISNTGLLTRGFSFSEPSWVNPSIRS